MRIGLEHFSHAISEFGINPIFLDLPLQGPFDVVIQFFGVFGMLFQRLNDAPLELTLLKSQQGSQDLIGFGSPDLLPEHALLTERQVSRLQILLVDSVLGLNLCEVLALIEFSLGLLSRRSILTPNEVGL